jgi:hypothetical protein
MLNKVTKLPKSRFYVFGFCEKKQFVGRNATPNTTNSRSIYPCKTLSSRNKKIQKNTKKYKKIQKNTKTFAYIIYSYLIRLIHKYFIIYIAEYYYNINYFNSQHGCTENAEGKKESTNANGSKTSSKSRW